MASIGDVYPKDVEKTANDQIHSIKERTQDFAQKAREKTEALADDAMEMVRKHPKQTIGIAIAAGALLGAVIALTLKPDESNSERISSIGNDAWKQLKNGLDEASSALRESLQRAIKTIK